MAYLPHLSIRRALLMAVLATCTLPLASLAGGRYKDQVIYISASMPTRLRLPFNRIIVWDQRSDTSNIGFNRYGRRIRFDTSASFVIKRYIQAAIRNECEGDNTVILNIRQLKVSGKSVLFSGDFYHVIGDSMFIWLATSDSLRKPIHEHTRTAVEALMQTLISEVNTAFRSENVINRVPAGRFAALYDGQRRYPIIESATYPAQGYYRSFHDFQNNALVPWDYQIQRMADSSYEVYFSQHHSFRDSAAFLEKAWAVADCSGTLYMHILDNVFLPLRLERDTFYLRVPSTLPNMYAFQRLQEMMNANQGGGGSSGPIDLGNMDGRAWIVFGVVIGALIVTYIAYTAIQNGHLRKVYVQGVAAKDFRECTIDMDTGDIINTRRE